MAVTPSEGAERGVTLLEKCICGTERAETAERGVLTTNITNNAAELFEEPALQGIVDGIDLDDDRACGVMDGSLVCSEHLMSAVDMKRFRTVP
eukprot:CAMPEP_0174719292 /NCGR_PEP_ID=MMETSP1094-20130205/30895_1 /TAXON_ID=156173 /ORGANISM="Chrysochromulina brevifilum, Strain UTEX LB 985" /LENGTH=92 /DNA_ID=CAMNT_0015919567 /DNA_START=240 /DNA_END=516 /DNA_ORIENTATION=+